MPGFWGQGVALRKEESGRVLPLFFSPSAVDILCCHAYCGQVPADPLTQEEARSMKAAPRHPPAWQPISNHGNP